MGFLWQVSRGSRLRPWKSPYLRWRIETYSGLPASSIGAATFWRFLWRERQRLRDYLEWAAAMRSGTAVRPKPPRPPAAP